MKNGFIRALWGIHGEEHRFLKRRDRVDKNILNISRSLFNSQFVSYVLGEENYRFLKYFGFNCVLVDKEPYLFDPIKHKYRNKLEIIKYAMENDKYDEIVYLDWDCVPLKMMDDNFWNILRKKEKIQANLQIYKRRKVKWREDKRKVPNGGFIYIRDKTIPSEVIKLWEELGKEDNDEPAWAKYIDNYCGTWIGIEKYWNLFEPMVCNLWMYSVYPDELINKKDLYFKHFQGAT
jgi:hypothetical protein